MLDPKKETNQLLFVVLCFSLMISMSCNSGKKSSDKDAEEVASISDSTMIHFSEVFKTDAEMTFRAVSFYMTKEQVKSIEAQHPESMKLVEDVKNMLFYEIDLTTDTSKSIDYAEIKYFFDVQDALDIISINYYILDSLTISNLSETIFEQMTAKYGDSYIDSEDYVVWESSFTPEGGESSTLFEIATKKLTKLNDPGITIEYLKY